MSRRNRGRERGMFEGLQDAPTLEETSNAIFSAGDLPATPPIKVKFIDIDSIYPDPTQPRRTIPSEIRQLWQGNSSDISELIVMWLDYVGEKNGSPFQLEAYLLGGETERSAEDGKLNFEPSSAVEAGLFHLVELASSIYRDGLTNPITLSHAGKEYLIETGERRWLAYHLLNAYFREDDQQNWSKIPARIVPERNVWRQATENNSRENLNAVARARQLSILLMDLHGWNNFESIEKFEHERDFYAQVADGNEWAIPYGKAEQLLNAMGLNNRTQLRQYRAILRLDYDVWEDADDHDWTEYKIRQLMNASTTEPESERSVTAVTHSAKLTPVERAYERTQRLNYSIASKAGTSSGASRKEWGKFAQQQADWWADLARKLQDET